MAKRLGLECAIVIPDGVSEQAINNIAGEGAEITIIDGDYDEAVELAKEITSTLDNAIHVQDMSWPGYEQIPNWIIEGYTTLCVETDNQLLEIGSGPADLVAAPVGVGAFLHSVLAHYRSQPGRNPVVLSVEAIGAACVLKSLQNGELTSVETVPTIMAGMNCGTPSSDSWPTHQAGVDAAVALTDDDTRLDLKVLADFGVDAGRSAGFPGVWVGDEKIAQVGISCSKWVAAHGFAINVSPDLTFFERIVPCGIRDRAVTSMERVLGPGAPPPTTAAVQRAVMAAFARRFGAQVELVPTGEEGVDPLSVDVVPAR
jgi:hypothetical protein